MVRLWHNNYLPSKPIETAMRNFSRHFKPEQKVLDIGCGFKPYAHFFNCGYVGLDPLPETHPDVVGQAWDLPFPDHSFDGVVLNQALEHIAETNATIQEIKRVLKPGGLAIITVPQTMKNHSLARPASAAPVKNFDPQEHPYWHVDYWRFTKFGLFYLFRDFTIVSLQETNGYFGSLVQLINYFLCSTPLDRFLKPIYLLNNLVGIFLDQVFFSIGRLPHSLFQNFHHYLYTSLTINLILIVHYENPTPPAGHP